MLVNQDSDDVNGAMHSSGIQRLAKDVIDENDYTGKEDNILKWTIDALFGTHLQERQREEEQMREQERDGEKEVHFDENNSMDGVIDVTDTFKNRATSHVSKSNTHDDTLEFRPLNKTKKHTAQVPLTNIPLNIFESVGNPKAKSRVNPRVKPVYKEKTKIKEKDIDQQHPSRAENTIEVLENEIDFNNEQLEQLIHSDELENIGNYKENYKNLEKKYKKDFIEFGQEYLKLVDIIDSMKLENKMLRKRLGEYEDM